MSHKDAANRALIDALHGNGEQTVQGLPPIVVSQPHPLPQQLEREASDLPGWGPGYVLPDGARLIFGDLGGGG